MRISDIVICLLALAICARMLPSGNFLCIAPDSMLTESPADIGDPDENEKEKSSNTRHPVMHGVARALSILSAKAVHAAVHDLFRIGDRGADDIPTPPPDVRC